MWVGFKREGQSFWKRDCLERPWNQVSGKRFISYWTTWSKDKDLEYSIHVWYIQGRELLFGLLLLQYLLFYWFINKCSLSLCCRSLVIKVCWGDDCFWKRVRDIDKKGRYLRKRDRTPFRTIYKIFTKCLQDPTRFL